jgi:hypothetical protein
MVGRIEPDRYADTGFAVKDTAPEVNARLFAAMMRRTPEDRLLMGFDMLATARAMVWSSVADVPTLAGRRQAFFARFYGQPLPAGLEISVEN